MAENVVQIKDGKMINIGASVKIINKNHRVCDKDYIWNPATYSCENGKYLPMTFYNVEILIKSVFNKGKNNYYYS